MTCLKSFKRREYWYSKRLGYDFKGMRALLIGMSLMMKRELLPPANKTQGMLSMIGFFKSSIHFDVVKSLFIMLH